MARRVRKDLEDRYEADGAEFDPGDRRKRVAFVAATAKRYTYAHGEDHDYERDGSGSENSEEDGDTLQGLEGTACPHRAAGCHCNAQHVRQRHFTFGFMRARLHADGPKLL
jgi:hypothetical protein